MLCPSAHKYSYFGPADIIGQTSGVQNSIKIPYKTFIQNTNKIMNILIIFINVSAWS